MKKRNRKDIYWKGCPEELRLMCQAELLSREQYCTKPVIKYLIDHIYECDTFMTGVTVYDVIHWIDRGMETCLFPLELYYKEWIENIEDIRTILNRSEELLRRIAPEDLDESYRLTYDDLIGTCIVEYAQKLDVYFSILYMFTEEWENLQDSLNNLLLDTERNIKSMIFYDDCEKFVSCDDWAEDYHYTGTEKWEPINWIYKECIPCEKAIKLYGKVYEQYTLFLNDLNNSLKSKACEHLCIKAENRLMKLCDFILTEIDDEIEFSEGDEKELSADKNFYVTILNNSLERYNEYNDIKQ